MNLKQPATILLGEGPGMVDGSSPPHEITIDSSLNLGKNLQVDLLYRYVSPLTALKVPAYHTGDVHAAWRLNDHVEFSVTGQNLFQPYHVEYAGDPGPPVAIRRNVYATLAWRSK
jgi:iron complex outermembrane receptor protein